MKLTNRVQVLKRKLETLEKLPERMPCFTKKCFRASRCSTSTDRTPRVRTDLRKPGSARNRPDRGTLQLMAATVNVNGRLFDQEHAVISVFDHGFLYGEGVYETWRTYNGQPFLFERHMQRLRKSAGMLALSVPLDDAAIDARFRETMRAAKLGDAPDREAYIRILVTRGIGELTYDPAATPNPSIIVIVNPHVAPSREIF